MRWGRSSRAPRSALRRFEGSGAPARSPARCSGGEPRMRPPATSYHTPHAMHALRSRSSCSQLSPLVSRSALLDWPGVPPLGDGSLGSLWSLWCARRGRGVRAGGCLVCDLCLCACLCAVVCRQCPGCWRTEFPLRFFCCVVCCRARVSLRTCARRSYVIRPVYALRSCVSRFPWFTRVYRAPRREDGSKPQRKVTLNSEVSSDTSHISLPIHTASDANQVCSGSPNTHPAISTPWSLRCGPVGCPLKLQVITFLC